MTGELEKAARAIQRALREEPNTIVLPNRFAEMVARAALQSLIPPSEEMVEAMDKALFAEVDAYSEPTKDDVARAFTAAINHILSQGEGR